MDIVSHGILGILFAKEVSLLAVAGGLFPDIDKLYTLAKGRYRREDSRTWFQEPPFLSFVVVAGFLLGIPAFSLGVISHYFIDFITGSTRPFNPFNKKVIDFNLSIPQKIALGAVIWFIGAAVFMDWIKLPRLFQL